VSPEDAASRFGPLVTTEWLNENLAAPDLRIADVRWYLDPARKGRDAYRAGHIPGAVFLDMDADLAAPGGARGGPLGRHPWPSPEQVERVMSAAGVGETTRVVAYDDQSGAMAARLWYLLRAYGHEAVAVLDGGFGKWQAETRPIDTNTTFVSPAVFRARPQSGAVLTKTDMHALPSGTLVLDARAAERYRGEAEPIDPRAGHIPGACNAPFAANLTKDPVPVFRPPEELRAHYASLGAEKEPPVVYCGSGVTACHDLLALEIAGLRGRLYAGSWSEWSSDPALPIELRTRT
jgi:thiosulfate/3-mercaptopyruvate sulfurtransferase